MKIQKNYYALEGLNGVGKSSVLSGLVSSNFFKDKIESHEMIVYHDPLPEFDPKLLSYFDSNDYQLSAQLYCVSSYLSQNKILSISKNHKIIFSDRSVVSTCTYYDGIDEAWLINIHKYCMFPAVVFLLTAPEEDVKSRLIYRYGSSKCTEYRIEVEANKGLLERYRAFFRNYPSIKLVEFENSNGMLNETVQDILSYMRENI